MYFFCLKHAFFPHRGWFFTSYVSGYQRPLNVSKVRVSFRGNTGKNMYLMHLLMEMIWEGEVLKAFLLRHRFEIVSITLGN